MTEVYVDLSRDGRRMEVRFDYDAQDVKRIKAVPGRSWLKAAKCWSIPADLQSGQNLRALFGTRLRLSDRVWEWGAAEREHQAAIDRIVESTAEQLTRLPKSWPLLYEQIHVGPLWASLTPAERKRKMKEAPSYQTNDVAFMVAAKAPLNANQPGTGKTKETIAAIYEAGAQHGPQLVIAPKSSLQSVWGDELSANPEGYPVVVAEGNTVEKAAALDEFLMQGGEEGGWFVTNSTSVRAVIDYNLCGVHKGKLDNGMSEQNVKAFAKECGVCKPVRSNTIPGLAKIKWNSIVIDEAHKEFRNSNSLAAQGLEKLTCVKKYGLTGTPMGGKMENLFGLLRLMDPKNFSNKWVFLERWTNVSNNGFANVASEGLRTCPQHRKYKGIDRPDCDGCRQIEDEFYYVLRPYMTRRTKAEVLPWLPAKQFVDLWVPWASEAHKKQYLAMESEAAAEVEGERIQAASVLAVYTRLKQFAFGKATLGENSLIMPTADSAKLALLLEKLDELGILTGESSEQAVVFSQFTGVVDVIAAELQHKGVPTGVITGATTGKGQRYDLQKRFQGGELRVMVMNTMAGGTAITLDRASNVFVMDETWVPDDQEQAVDRCHRGSRIHQVTVFNLRTKNSIEAKIAQTNRAKAGNSFTVLDLKRLVDPDRLSRQAKNT